MNSGPKTILDQIDAVDKEFRKILKSPIIDALAQQKKKTVEAQGELIKNVTEAQVELIKTTIGISATSIFIELDKIRGLIKQLAQT